MHFEFSEFRLATYVLALGLGWLLAYLLTPVVRQVSLRFDFVDRPGGRKTHKAPVALGGGLAVFGAALGAVLVAYLFADWAQTKLFFGNDARWLAGLLAASALTLAVGLYDDALDMRGRTKLLWQIGIASMLVYLGLRIDKIGLFGADIDLGWFSIPLTVFWLVGATNAINLLDGIDGLASSIGVVICLTMAGIDAAFGRFPEAVVTLALAGALGGFLRYNFAPASIYLGDAGSMVVGLVVGAIAVQTNAKTPAVVAMTIPLAVWAIPILDSAAAIVRRRLTGRSIFAPDRGHLHHSLLTRGWSVRQASLFIALICATTCLSALLGVVYQNEWIVLGGVVAVVVFLVATKTFGHVEFALLRHHVRQHVMNYSRREQADAVTQPGSHGIVRLQGSHEWERLWLALVEAAPRYGLTRMQVSVHLPAVHEAFFATWRAPKGSAPKSPDRAWRVSHPLCVDGEPVGRLDLAGVAGEPGAASLGQLSQVIDFLEPIEEDIRRVRDGLGSSAAAEPKPAPAATDGALVGAGRS